MPIVAEPSSQLSSRIRCARQMYGRVLQLNHFALVSEVHIKCTFFPGLTLQRHCARRRVFVIVAEHTFVGIADMLHSAE